MERRLVRSCFNPVPVKWIQSTGPKAGWPGGAELLTARATGSRERRSGDEFTLPGAVPVTAFSHQASFQQHTPTLPRRGVNP